MVSREWPPEIQYRYSTGRLRDLHQLHKQATNNNPICHGHGGYGITIIQKSLLTDHADCDTQSYCMQWFYKEMFTFTIYVAPGAGMSHNHIGG